MSFYLYLNEYWHVDAWVNGGPIPINPASTYLSMDRSGVFTPDENLIHKSEIDLMSLSPFVHIEPGAQIRGLTMLGCSSDGVKIPDIRDAHYYTEDGLILSFSYRLTGVLARKMNKKACVKILDMSRLKDNLDAQIGVASKAKQCEYTSGHERNHFLKSELDSWQAEFRLFWAVRNKVEVILLPGTAELICTW